MDLSVIQNNSLAGTRKAGANDLFFSAKQADCLMSASFASNGE